VVVVRQKGKVEGLTGDRLRLVHRYMSEEEEAALAAAQPRRRWTPRPRGAAVEEELSGEDSPAAAVPAVPEPPVVAPGPDPRVPEPAVVAEPAVAAEPVAAAEPAHPEEPAGAAEPEAVTEPPAGPPAAARPSGELPVHEWVNAGLEAEANPDWPQELVRQGLERSRRARSSDRDESFF
jgi:hypothetical protein